MSNLTYRELQQALRLYRDRGLTSIKLNAKKDVLEAELYRIEANIERYDHIELNTYINTNEGELYALPQDNKFSFDAVKKHYQVLLYGITYYVSRLTDVLNLFKTQTNFIEKLEDSLIVGCILHLDKIELIYKSGATLLLTFEDWIDHYFDNCYVPRYFDKLVLSFYNQFVSDKG